MAQCGSPRQNSQAQPHCLAGKDMVRPGDKSMSEAPRAPAGRPVSPAWYPPRHGNHTSHAHPEPSSLYCPASNSLKSEFKLAQGRSGTDKHPGTRAPAPGAGGQGRAAG